MSKKLIWAFILTAIFFSFSCTAVTDRSHESDEEWQKKNLEHYQAIPLSIFKDSINGVRKQFKDNIPPYPIYEDNQIVGITENILALQNPDGGWAKNTDWGRIYSREELEKLHQKTLSVKPLTYEHKENGSQSTLDNDTIYTHVEYLCKVYQQVKDRRYIESAKRALQWIINAQHPKSGGWTGSDVYAITYNDGAMSGVLELLREIFQDKPDYFKSLGSKAQKEAKAAYDRGIQCVIKTQIHTKLDDGRTITAAWGQQHDHETLQPIWAREFEPPSICTIESINLLISLMKDKSPSKELQECIDSACKWLMSEDIVIRGKRLEEIPAEPEVSAYGRYSDYETILVDDKDAPPLWARMYDLKTLKPVFCDRGRRFVDSFNELSRERRNGYSYLGNWGPKIKAPYEEWKNRR